MRALDAWRGGLILIEGTIGVWSMSFLFSTRLGVYEGVRVCIRTHTHTVEMGYLDVSPGVGMRHLKGPKDPDGLSLGMYIYIRVSVQVHMCMYMLGGEMRLWTRCFVL